MHRHTHTCMHTEIHAHAEFYKHMLPVSFSFDIRIRTPQSYPSMAGGRIALKQILIQPRSFQLKAA